MIMFLFGSWIDYVIHAILIISIIGTFGGALLSFIPFVKQYMLPVRIISALLLITAIFFEGYLFAGKLYREKIAEYEAKVKLAEEKSKETNKQLSVVMKQKSKDIRTNQVVIQKQLKELSNKIDAQCKVVPEAIEIHNKATKK